MKCILSACALLLLPTLAHSQQVPLQSFPLSSVALLGSPFREAQQTDQAYVMVLDPDRLLAPFQPASSPRPSATAIGKTRASTAT
jgi:hypothetical protein